MCHSHIIHERRNGICAICLDPTDKPIERDTLTCGHTFHTHCLQKYGVPVCSLCRHRMDPTEASRILGFPKFSPIISRIFSAVDPTNLPQVMSIMDKVVSIASRGKWQSTYLNTMMDMFEVACVVVETSADPSVFGHQHELAMTEMMEVFGKMYMHIASNGTFEGFGVDGFRNRLYCYTYPITVIEQPVFEAPIHINIPVPQPIPILAQPQHQPPPSPVLITGQEEIIMGGNIQYDRVSNVVIGGTRLVTTTAATN